MTYTHKYIVLGGAAPDTGNGGVTALCESALIGLTDRGIHKITVLVHGNAPSQTPFFSSKKSSIVFHPLRGGKRWYDKHNMINARIRQQIGLPSPFTKLLSSSAGYLDVSGGDSFTDLYGANRFRHIALPKIMAISSGTPLILLPQTYGPFMSQRVQKIAKFILSRATLAFARDEDSYQRLQDILGSQFDANRHKLGVDLAFGLPKASLLNHPKAKIYATKPVGINVSGLLWNNPEKAKSQFGLKVDYKRCLINLCHRIAYQSDKDIMLIPHVLPKDPSENDLIASRDLKRLLSRDIQHRIHIEDTAVTPQNLKDVISKCSWFTGSRMHATLAALSTCVPVVNMSYSLKSAGVFDTCNSRSYVYDLRQLSTEDMTGLLFNAFKKRDQQKLIIEEALPQVQTHWNNQMNLIAAKIHSRAKLKGHDYAHTFA